MAAPVSKGVGVSARGASGPSRAIRESGGGAGCGIAGAAASCRATGASGFGAGLPARAPRISASGSGGPAGASPTRGAVIGALSAAGTAAGGFGVCGKGSAVRGPVTPCSSTGRCASAADLCARSFGPSRLAGDLRPGRRGAGVALPGVVFRLRRRLRRSVFARSPFGGPRGRIPRRIVLHRNARSHGRRRSRLPRCRPRCVVQTSRVPRLATGAADHDRECPRPENGGNRAPCHARHRRTCHLQHPLPLGRLLPALPARRGPGACP